MVRDGIWVLAAVLWAIAFFQNLCQKTDDPSEKISRTPRWATITQNIKQNGKLVLTILAVFGVANIVFVSLVKLGLSNRFIGYTPSLEPFYDYAFTCIALGAMIQATDLLIKNSYINRVLKWVAIAAYVLSYFALMLWFMNLTP
jgi:hypothetical protein